MRPRLTLHGAVRTLRWFLGSPQPVQHSGLVRLALRSLVRATALLLAGAAVAACESAPPVDDLPLATCLCTDGVCPPDRCGLQLEVAADNCTGEVTKVEVILGSAVDPEILRPGQKTRTCLTLGRGETATFYARSDGDWQWQETLTCPAAQPGESQGPIIARVLNCSTN